MTSLYEKDYNRTYYFDIRGIGTAKENTTIHIILGLLNHEDLSGCDIKKRADYMIASFWEIGYGQIYPTLAKLEQEGLVTKRISGESKGPERNLYSIIGAGRETLTQWLKVQEQKEYTKYEILLKLFFGSLVPMEESAKRIDAFKTRHMENLNMIQMFKANLQRVMDEDRDHLFFILPFCLGSGFTMRIWKGREQP